jgi:hypothetical protein
MTTANVIANLDQISTEWLTSVLSRSGALTNGAVQSFELGMGQGNWPDYETMMREKFGKDLTPHRVKYRTLKR